MCDRPRGRRSSRERILDAAAELVSEVGSGHLTLEAVAERAGLSKGGLLYNYPIKDALLAGMVERLIQEATAEREKRRATLTGARNLEARLTIAATLETRCGKMKEVANGLLAASAENPGLLDPVRTAVAQDWQRLKATSEDPVAAMLCWLAVEGLSSLDMHDISPVSEQDRTAVVAAIDRLLDRGLDNATASDRSAATRRDVALTGSTSASGGRGGSSR